MTQRSKLDEVQARLDEIDREILRQVERRARIVQDLVGLRAESAKFAPIVDAGRVAALERAVASPVDPRSIRPIFAAIDAACRVQELSPRIAVVGAEGGFSWLAAATHFGPRAEPLRCETADKALEEVSRGHAEYALVVYETLREGLAFSTISAIASHDLRLVGEREVVHVLSLLSKSGQASEVERIYVAPSHHVLVEQFLETRFPKASVIDVRSAAVAWDLAAENHGAAAVVPRGLSGHEPLSVVAESIADEGEIRVRYGVVSRTPMSRTGSDATALLFSVPDHPGALHDVLEEFKTKSCNLRRIQSRAVPGEGWEYVFYVEVGGHVTDRPLVSALEGVKKKTRMLKIVGSFPLTEAEPPTSGDAR